MTFGIASVAGITVICYLLGTIWLSRQAGMGFSAALAAGVIPFIPADAVKIAVAALVGPVIRKRLFSKLS